MSVFRTCVLCKLPFMRNTPIKQGSEYDRYIDTKEWILLVNYLNITVVNHTFFNVDFFRNATTSSVRMFFNVVIRQCVGEDTSGFLSIDRLCERINKLLKKTRWPHLQVSFYDFSEPSTNFRLVARALIYAYCNPDIDSDDEYTVGSRYLEQLHKKELTEHTLRRVYIQRKVLDQEVSYRLIEDAVIRQQTLIDERRYFQEVRRLRNLAGLQTDIVNYEENVNKNKNIPYSVADIPTKWDKNIAKAFDEEVKILELKHQAFLIKNKKSKLKASEQAELMEFLQNKINLLEAELKTMPGVIKSRGIEPNEEDESQQGAAKDYTDESKGAKPKILNPHAPRLVGATLKDVTKLTPHDLKLLDAHRQ